MKLKFGLIGVGVLVGVALALIGWQVFNPYQYQGSLIEPPIPAADFELTDQHGDGFRLSDQQGKVVLIFFGYTHCPDVCPVTLSEFLRVKEALGEQAGQVRFVFVTVDPERDTPQRLGQHLQNFDPDFIGLTGERAALEQVWADYGVYAARAETDSAAGYLVDHTARIYAIDKQGNWRLTYPFGMEVEKLIQDVIHLVAEKG